MQVTYGADELFMDDNISTYYYNSYTPEIAKHTFLFTDRSILQARDKTIFFKGIVTSKEKEINKSGVIPNFKTTIQLKDAKRAKKRLNLLLPPMSSAVTKALFKLPEGVMNGNFSLYDTANKIIRKFLVLRNTSVPNSLPKYKNQKALIASMIALKLPVLQKHMQVTM